MKIAVLSDIHGNHIALERCLHEVFLRGIERFIFLGDYLGDFAYPQKTMRILYDLAEKYDCEFIRGNKEEYWINYRENGACGWKKQDSITGCMFYNYHELTEKDFSFYENLPNVKKLEFENLPSITICHGSPRRTKEKMLPGNEETLDILESSDTDLILCGHTHVPDVIVYKGKRAVNPGTVGVALNGEKKAPFLILHGENGVWKEEFVSLDYDMETTIQELHESGLYENAPSWCRITEHLLRSGKGSHGAVLERAMKLCAEENGSCTWPDVPERFMEKAIEEFL